MAWEDALDYLDKYREEHAKALDNEQRAKWSTHEVDDLAELVEKFNSDAENAEWEEMHDKPLEENEKIAAVRLKVHFLAGSRRDIRTQFAASADDRVRTDLDQRRFEYMRLAFHKLKMDLFRQQIDGMAEGGSIV